MNESNPQIKKIERDEAWLVGVMSAYPEPAPRRIEHLKLSVRIAAQQHVFDGAITPPPSRETMDRVKQAVRAELNTQAAGRRSFADRWGGMRWSSLMGGLAAAAALAFWFVPDNVTTLQRDQDPIAFDWPNLDDVTGADEWSAQIAAFKSELEEVTDLLVSDDSGWDDYRQSDLESIDDEIDELFQELESALET